MGQLAEVAPGSGSLAIDGLVGELRDRSFLESAWRAALPVTSASPAPALTRRQYAIGNLLSDGLKDEVIARSLGLSLRTIRAEVSALCAALDATSRFQAGARFARLTQ